MSETGKVVEPSYDARKRIYDTNTFHSFLCSLILSLRPEYLDKFALRVAHWTSRKAAAALKAANLVSTGCGAAIDLSIEADDASLPAVRPTALCSTRLAASHRNAVVNEGLINAQAAGLRNIIEACLVPARANRKLVSGS